MFNVIGSSKLVRIAIPLRSCVKKLSTTSQLSQIYKIQSQEDFNEKVKNSKTPVVVDFFATYVISNQFLILNCSKLIKNFI